MRLEAIATNMHDIITLDLAGVDRIELCGFMERDGLTPDRKLILDAVYYTNNPINVMIRPHDDSFSYTEDEISRMIADIEYVKSAGANGVVLGVLSEDKTVDTASLERFIAAADGLEITFHKAFDELEDQEQGLSALLQYPEIKTLLTSGGTGSSLDNLQQLKQLNEITNDANPVIMPGGGITTDNVEELIQYVKPDIVHFGTGIRERSSYNRPISKEKIKKIRKIAQGI